jgi:hypothetical protein
LIYLSFHFDNVVVSAKFLSQSLSVCGLPSSYRQVSSLFSVYLLANDVGDTESCVTQYCASERPDDGIDFIPTADEGCSDPSPRQCGQDSASEDECGCLDLLFLPSDVDGAMMFPQLCRNNLQGGRPTPGVFDASPWQLWVDGQPQGEEGPLETIPTARPAKVEVDLFDDVGIPPSATILEAQIEENYDHIVIPFRLSDRGRLSFMLTNITLPTEVDVIEGAAGRPSIQGFQVGATHSPGTNDTQSHDSASSPPSLKDNP